MNNIKKDFDIEIYEVNKLYRQFIGNSVKKAMAKKLDKDIRNSVKKAINKFMIECSICGANWIVGDRERELEEKRNWVCPKCI